MNPITPPTSWLPPNDVLRTRVDVATEVQNQQLQEKLTRGQGTQVCLQTTVEGLSIAAISYYVISLLLHGGKALKAAGGHQPRDGRWRAGARGAEGGVVHHAAYTCQAAQWALRTFLNKSSSSRRFN